MKKTYFRGHKFMGILCSAGLISRHLFGFLVSTLVGLNVSTRLFGVGKMVIVSVFFPSVVLTFIARTFGHYMYI